MKSREIKYCFYCVLLTCALTSLPFVTGEAKGKVRRYATETETLERVFPGATYHEEIITITPKMREQVTTLMGKKFYDREFKTYRVVKDNKELAYSIIMNEVGKTKEITFMVTISPEGKVIAVDILVFRESQGYEIKNKRWLKQFFDKSKTDRLRVKRDIDNISGATLSARAVTKGVKKALFIFEVITK